MNNTIDKKDYSEIGSIQKPHGLKGESILFFEPNFEVALEEAEIVFVEIEGGLVPFFISEDGLRFRTSESAIVQFDECQTQEQAKAITGCKVFLPNEDLIGDQENNELTYLIGFLVFDNKRGKVGKITHVDDYAGNIVITVQHAKNEILIPLSDRIITNLDEEKKELHLDCPEGLIELYLE